MSDFVHLHAHSEYSLLDGLSNIKRLTERTAELGMDTLALTDHGVVYGAIEFYTAAKKAGIKPIIGCEAYVATARHNDRTPQGKGYFHTVLLAKNEQGYRNLLKLTTRAHLDGYYYKPRIDRELLAEHKEGLIVTQACVSGEVNRRLTQKDKEGARAAAAWYRDLLGPEHYYLELQLHPEVPELDEINQELVRIGRELGIPLVATNDAHYVDQSDAETHRMLRCLGFNTTVPEYCAKNPVLDDSYYLQSPDQMKRLMAAYPFEAIENTRRIADMCNLELDFGRVQLPDFPLPEGYSPSSYLQLLSEEGLRRRLGDLAPRHYWERLQYELDVINQTGFPLYMLIVWDFVKFARANNIPCLPRGSAGGSLVSYCLGITDVDPVANKLVFERWLNPERKEMPDIDMDFADSRRAEILDYVAQKYGRERTAQIITFGTLGAKAAVRDVGRVLSIPLNTVDQVAKLVPKLPVGTTLTQSLDRVPELKKLYDGDAQVRDLIDKARKLEGVTRNVGTHACGVVVSAQPLDQIIPLQRTARDDSAIMASFPGPTLGDMGLLKMDILGLANLSIVAAALEYISEELGRPYKLEDVPADDPATFELLSRGNTLGVFQLESPPMVRYLKELRPTRIDDIYAMVALYRPGPMEQIPQYIEWKNHPERIRYLHPILKPILEDTYGIIVYQEQVLGILMQMAGYTMGKADVVRKAIGKKNRELMAQEEPRFIDGCKQNGLTEDQAGHLWSLIQPFAGYSFNRAHSTLYGLLSYQTAYLKTNFPTEYMAALLSSASGNMEDVARYVGEAMRLGVAVLPPDVNKSGLGFTIERLEGELPAGVTHPKAVRFGLSAVKNVGEGPIKAICAARDKDGPFQSLEELCERVDRKELGKRVLEALIKCGALQTLPGSRHAQIAVLDQVMSLAAEAQRTREAGQASMFDIFGAGETTGSSVKVQMPVLADGPAEQKEKLVWEKELLGMYISEHPVAQALQSLPDDPNRLTLSMIGEAHIGQTIQIIGMLTGLRKVVTKKGDTMLTGQVEDLEGSLEFVAFPRTYDKYADFWIDDNIVAVGGKVDNRRESLQLICETVAPFAEVAQAAPVVEFAAAAVGGFGEDFGGYDDADGPPLDDAAWSSLPTSPPAIHETTGGASTAYTSNGVGHAGGNGLANGVGHAGGSGYPNGSARSAANGRANGNGHANSSAEPTPSATGASTPVDRTPISASPETRASQSPPSAPAAPVTVIRPRQRIQIARKEDDTRPSAPAPTGPQYHLHITLCRSDDFDADVRCMQEVDKALRRFAGEHKVSLYMPRDDWNVVLEPYQRVNPSPELLTTLREILGDSRVQVESGS